ncbi:Zn-dependent hydrolase [Aquibacillus halophilus]|uniref:Zn-dependent hydrolase n=1 Tax=Aquibacillus halophilus TaxID=930132 RepID=UPI0030B82347
MDINEERLWSRINELGQVGVDVNGGLTRLSFSDEEREAKQLVKKYMTDAGLMIREDEIGNIFGRLAGTDPNGKTILIGSHVDTVLSGGIFDGTGGVLIGIEVVQSLIEQGVTPENSVEVVAFTDEEGTRFSTGMIGSKGYTGQLTSDELVNHVDEHGISIAQAMINQGYDPNKLASVKVDPETIKCFLEVHIEQGKILESKNVPIGLVTGIVGLRWLKVKLSGEAGHAGTTPMSLRKDPLAAAAEIIQYIEKLAKEQERTVATVGQLAVNPGGVNIIPSDVEFTIDLRDLSDELLDQLLNQVNGTIESICSKRGITSSVEEIHNLSGVSCSSEINESIRASIEKQGIEVVELPSGAGHDAMVMANFTQTGMIFLRTKNGISHTPEEWADKKDITVAAQTMGTVLLHLFAD